jgi:CxxC motif-containing protein (DUF1111 family)
MRRVGRIAGGLAIGLCVMGVATFGQGPPPPPPPPPGQQPPPPPGPGQPFPTLTKAELSRWNIGKAAFLQPATVPGGLGPVFNESSCVTCHGGPQAPGGSGLELVTRFGRYVNSQFDPLVAFGGPSIQAKGIGKFNGVNFVGEVVPPQATIVVHRRTIPLYGLGLVDAIPEAAIVALAEHQHEVSPATAGVPSVATDPTNGESAIGRFGWKAQQPSLFDFSADALLNEMGVTTPVYPSENCPQGNCAILSADPAKTNPNAPSTLIQQLADFMTFTAPPTPPPTAAPTPAVKAGQTIFGMIGCAACHQPTWQTGPNASPTLNQVVFAPYSDFLLHDMGGLGDGIPQASATPTQMRTAPLWGLQFEQTFLHDGRAKTVDQAIKAHQGQGASASTNYSNLTATQKNQLLAFLNSL